ncbi:hypothetical protein ACTOB_008280 [Actinoplanes oblitus]|uniref:Serine/threonine protein kinase n=1 Tax=Actinoplanes oblitus TaxID=3040509 RepID=A0ABY8WK43_9ACTN|nr:hypothetical protein [Actinoplanes oblitus]WIM96120.1 hypothetical protein ACTOB_008280 [Actinoplanes oblitus]
MLLSPKSVFIGVLAVGLPFAVVVGWALGTPKAHSVASAEIGGTGGSDALGVAPPHTRQSPDGHPARPAGGAPSSIVVVSSTVITQTVTVPASATPSAAAATSSPPPILSTPPVPTPTQITGPPEPTPTPSDSVPPSTDTTSASSAPPAP